MNVNGLQFIFTVASGSSRKALRTAERDDTETSHGREVDLSQVPPPESTMVSFATQMNKPWPGPDWFIDSGGFSTLKATGGYDDPVEEYIEYLAHHESREGVNIDKFALRDWACEKELLRENGRDVRLHQNWTIRDHIDCLEIADEYGIEADPVAVIQGYDTRDYLRHIDYYRDHGLLTDHLGIGSVCKRKNVEEVRALISQIRDELPDRITIHGFGLSIDMLHIPDIVENLDSVDTAAWDHKAYYDSISNASTEGHRYTWDRVQDSYTEYRAKVEQILQQHSQDDRTTKILSIESFSNNATVDITKTHPILKCICGTLLDPESPQTHTSTCRHCQRAQERYTMALRGLCCDPEFDTHHPICPRHSAPYGTCISKQTHTEFSNPPTPEEPTTNQSTSGTTVQTQFFGG